ncbi:unnamed protein product [Bursaphelenchus okinawaensis]|uniref:Galectin n=1 Tax=Bursaphelenchus okinawaensis TaxID=465554 RepID=A0A811JRX6_9BILA|nr:unnamed protein product [Bursaphelenchus okinawaensis]CAG9080443.1 unnamed protein product [Bursaphelenchus okinawaensis]
MGRHIIQNDCETPCNNWDESTEISYDKEIHYLNPVETNTIRLIYKTAHTFEVHINENVFDVPVRLKPGNALTKFTCEGDVKCQHLCATYKPT